MIGPVKRINPDFAGWIAGRESHAHWIYQIADGKTIDNGDPVLAIPQLPERLIASRTNRLPPQFIAQLEWGRVATAKMEVISPDDDVFNEFVHTNQPPGLTRSTQVPLLPRLRRKAGTYVLVSTGRSTNYYHWLNNCLPRLSLLEHASVEGEPCLILPESAHPFHLESSALLGFETRREFFGNDHWQVEHLILPSHTNTPSQTSPQAGRWIRDRLLSAVGAKLGDRTRRLYVSRAQASKRRLSNENEIIALLKPYGFEIITAEKMTFADQIKVFHEAEIVCGPHGAGLTNAMFMHANTLLIELVPFRRVKPCYYSLANALGLRYACVSDEELDHQSGKERAPDIDFTLPVDRLAQTLKTLGV